MTGTKKPAKKKSVRSKPLHTAAFERKYMIGGNMNFASAEAYKLLRTNLLFSFSGEDKDKGRVMGITSALKSEGKSITSLNLAYTMAETDKRVLFIEADMRLPTVAKRLQMQASPGLSNLLVGLNSVQDAVQTYTVTTAEGGTVTLDVLVSGDVPPNPSELLGTKRMRALLTALRDYYDFIIVDLPPVTAVADALVVSDMTDGIVVVVRSNRAVRGALQETIRQLKLVNARILGFVFNGVGEGTTYYKKGYGRGYSKYYSGEYSHDNATVAKK